MTQERNIKDLPQYATDKTLKGAADHFKDYCTIRRDLRDANDICRYTIALRTKIDADNSHLDRVVNYMFLIRASVMHALLLYSRWFKSTKGKPMLNPNDFFAAGSKEMTSHMKIIEMRDSYVAHNEKDILGGDNIWIKLDDDGKFISSRSDFLVQLWLQDKGLDMAIFQRLIWIVHNKLDAVTIPKAQQKLDMKLDILLGKSSSKTSKRGL